MCNGRGEIVLVRLGKDLLDYINVGSHSFVNESRYFTLVNFLCYGSLKKPIAQVLRRCTLGHFRYHQLDDLTVLGDAYCRIRTAVAESRKDRKRNRPQGLVPDQSPKLPYSVKPWNSVNTLRWSCQCTNSCIVYRRLGLVIQKLIDLELTILPS